MSLSPVQIIKAVCPELASSPSLDAFVQMATELTDRGFFGKLYNYAIAYKAAHLFTLSGGDGGGSAGLGLGQIASMSEGGLSISYATTQSTDASGLDTTKYGKMLLALLKTRPTAGVNTAGIFSRR